MASTTSSGARSQSKPALLRSTSRFGLPGGLPVPPVSCPPPNELDRLFPGPDAVNEQGRGFAAPSNSGRDGKMLLELADGTSFEGFGFGEDINISGECVFTTGTHSRSLYDGLY